MKKYKIILFANLLSLSLFATGVFSQPTNVFKADAIVHVSDTVVFRLTEHVGEHVKWQLSHNLEDWAEIQGATSDSLMFIADTTTYFRARVIAGFCDPFYSDIKKVQVDHQVEPGTVVDIDGNVYQTVIIGNQEWMAENLRVTRYNNEDDIPTGLSNTEWSNTTSGAYAIYNNSNDMLEAYGKLYNWYAVDDSRGLCPEGWSVPSDADWTALINYVVSEGFTNSNVTNGAGNALKSCRQVGSPLEGCNTSEHPRWNSHSTHYGFDEFGFSALPGGLRWSSGSFSYVGYDGNWWSATEYDGTRAWYRGMYSGNGRVNRYDYYKRSGFSVRCFRNISAYNLNLEVNPENAGIVNGAGIYPDGMLISVSANANEGWEFVNWTGDTEYLDDVNSAEAIVTMPADNVTLTAVFQEEDEPEPGTVTDIDGNVYQTVIIGNQEWMAENLRVTRYKNEDYIPTGLSDTEWGNTTSGAYALYPHEGGGVSEDDVEGINSDEEMAVSYGKLYNWYATTDARGLCPEGWNVPSDANWTQLINNLDGSNKGNMLKSCRQVDSPLEGDCNTGTHPRWNAHGTHYGIDAVGFAALPGGGRNHTHGYVLIGSFGFYWSSSSYSAANAWNRVMSTGSGSVNQVDNDKRIGLSVRCFRIVVRTEED